MLLDRYDEFRNRIDTLGNHNKKYLRVIDLHLDNLRRVLTGSGSMEENQLWLPTRNPAYIMESLDSLSDDPAERISFISTYFAIQILQMNIRSIDLLTAEPVEWQSRFERYRDFMIRTGSNLRRLLVPFINLLIKELGRDLEIPEFAICAVGTRADQDDLDVGIIDSGEGSRETLDRLIGRLSAAMIKYAIPLHLYLSEHVGPRGYTASIRHYEEMISKNLADFVMVSELLSAAFLVGSRNIFNQFKKRVIERYFYYEGEYNLFCEGYLRGMVGEISSIIALSPDEYTINPKRDALRVIKGLLATKKIIHGVREEKTWQLIRMLMRNDFRRETSYHELEQSLAFFEILRFLYQLLDVHDETIHLDSEPGMRILGKIARLMGYSDHGALDAANHLLATYHEQIDLIHRNIEPLLGDLEKHLVRTSKFNSIISKPGKSNFAVEVLDVVRSFRGATYWDDVLTSLAEDTNGFRRRLMDSITAMPPSRRQTMINRYVRFMMYDPVFLMKLLTILSKVSVTPSDREIATAYDSSFLNELEHLPCAGSLLAGIFEKYPAFTADYLSANRVRSLEMFSKVLNEKKCAGNSESAESLATLIRVMKAGSRFLHGFLKRCIRNTPESIGKLGEPDKMKALSGQYLTRALIHEEPERKKSFLADYFALGFVRIASEALRGASLDESNLEFTNLSDRHLVTLYASCKEEVEEELGEYLQVQDIFAVYASGGRARMQAFDDDYDMIVMLHSNDENLRMKMARVMSRMNREIAATGMLPHYRFSDEIDHYIILHHELEKLVASRRETDFIEKSQLLGSRMVIGTRLFEERFVNEVITPYIYEDSLRYAESMCNEIRARHASLGSAISRMDIKECPGGLRDIELILMVFKASLRLREPVTRELMEKIGKSVPGFRKEMDTLRKSMKFLKNLRDIYRLTTAPVNILEPEHLKDTAEIIGFDSVKELIDYYKKTTESSRLTILNLITEIEKNGWKVSTKMV